ncbi:AAA family ATPase [Avibacterium sp. 20-15]|uniref:AAA family ATPase n=1 Tax=unclassified Avibacterium TaxID=2685287 RepID=UPI0020269446|nr:MULTISPECIES: AAA family ATPase [unclassified Avibacterium]MCW9732614.1 AAA family ATPase [Avibacterium sp. 20-15]URL04765.1 AAA family ATPase [Avibacterium sp. 20-132]
MMKLKEIKFYGFQDSTRNIALNFSLDSNVTIIFGDNGCGKTTFLKLLNAILRRDDKVLLENNIEKVEITYHHNNSTKTICIAKVNKEEELKNKEKMIFDSYIKRKDSKDIRDIFEYFLNAEARSASLNDYDWKEFSESKLQDSTSLSIGIDRGSNWVNSKSFNSLYLKDFILRHRRYREAFNSINIDNFSEEFNQYINSRAKLNRKSTEIDFERNHIYLPKIELGQIENLLLEKYRLAKNETTIRIQNALFETLSTLIDGEKKEVKKYSDDIEEISNTQYKERIIDALSSISDNPLKRKVISLLNDEERMQDNGIIQTLIHNMVNELKKEEKSLSPMNLFVKIFNEHLSGEKELKLSFDKISIKIRNKEYDLGVLSSGEKHIFTLLAMVNLLGTSKNFLIIDEPEISLNVRWKRSLLSLLTKLLPATQIIVASHSPSIATDFTSSLKEIINYD